MTKHLPLIVIVASLILMIANIITSDELDRGFWMRIVSSLLLIFAMVLTIRSRKQDEKDN